MFSRELRSEARESPALTPIHQTGFHIEFKGGGGGLTCESIISFVLKQLLTFLIQQILF